jgi:hypothetical protein
MTYAYENECSHTYFTLEEAERLALVHEDPELALRFITIFGDKTMAERYVQAHPDLPSAYHIAQRLSLPYPGRHQPRTPVPPAPHTRYHGTLPDILRPLYKDVRDVVDKMSGFGEMKHMTSRIRIDTPPPVWDDIVRAYEENRG